MRFSRGNENPVLRGMKPVILQEIFIMSVSPEVLQEVVIKFAGDSGDGIQLTGNQFTNNTALLGIDLATFLIFRLKFVPLVGTTVPGVSDFS